jgi:hypothetical protein
LTPYTHHSELQTQVIAQFDQGCNASTHRVFRTVCHNWCVGGGALYVQRHMSGKVSVICHLDQYIYSSVYSFCPPVSYLKRWRLKYRKLKFYLLFCRDMKICLSYAYVWALSSIRAEMYTSH